MHITLRAGEKLYLNGAVLRADRKVSLELMNEASFLLEAHVMQVEKATSPLRQLYFIVQTMLISPRDTTDSQALYEASVRRMVGTYDDREAIEAIAQTTRLVGTGRYFDALKILRGAFARDDALMARGKPVLALAS